MIFGRVSLCARPEHATYLFYLTVHTPIFFLFKIVDAYCWLWGKIKDVVVLVVIVSSIYISSVFNIDV